VQAVVFDVDGTLVDTNYLHVRCWSEAFHQAGHVIEDARIHRAIGMGSTQLLAQLLGDDRDTSQDARIVDGHRTLYALHWGHLQPLPGARALLHACAERGLSIALATSAETDELRALRDSLDCDGVIDVCISAGDEGEGKPQPGVVKSALAKLDVDPDEALFVGDTVWDVEAGLRVPVRVFAVMTGGISFAELIGAGAERVFAGPRALLDHLDHAIRAG
jgi:HAD superfamily hydrolase (TIGR01509 family)